MTLHTTSQGPPRLLMMNAYSFPACVQALLLRLLAPSPTRRPPSMSWVIEHPFFVNEESFEAPKLIHGERNHLFLSHFQGNAVRGAQSGQVVAFSGVQHG